jgi:hypothetical protein
MEAKSKLEDLPESTSKFWVEAEVHTGIIAHDWMQDHLHSFVRVTGHQAYCEGCGWGFELDPGDKVIDGHLFDRTGKLVI